MADAYSDPWSSPTDLSNHAVSPFVSHECLNYHSDLVTDKFIEETSLAKYLYYSRYSTQEDDKLPPYERVLSEHSPLKDSCIEYSFHDVLTP